MTDDKDSAAFVTFLLDRSGSMEAIKDDTIGAFNAYLGGLKKDGAGIEFSLVQFDSMGIEKVHVGAKVETVPELNGSTFQPRGSTPLIDAACKTIKAVETAIAGRGSPKVVICIQTDGHENASTEYTWDDLNALIKEKAGAGWQFNFMGAGIDAYDQGLRMGIAADATVSYDSASPEATRAAFMASAENTSMFATGRASSTNYSLEQKASSGDKFAPKAGPLAKPKAPTAKRAIVEDFRL